MIICLCLDEEKGTSIFLQMQETALLLVIALKMRQLHLNLVSPASNEDLTYTHPSVLGGQKWLHNSPTIQNRLHTYTLKNLSFKTLTTVLTSSFSDF